MSPRPGSLSARLTSRTTVVVVEDEADIAGFLGAYFRASGLEMVHVNPRGTEEVVDAVRAHRAACVLLDLNLVGFSGLEVLARFRDDPALACIPVVVVSAHTAAAQQCRDLGARAFVAKPFNVSDLYDQVFALVSRDAAATARPSSSTPARAMTRDELEDKIGRALLRAHRDRTSISLVLVRVGAEAADGLRAALPTGAVVGCTGPDEIAVLLPGTEAAQASATVGAALAAIDDADRVRAGVAAAPEHASTIDELYMAADSALADACESDRLVATAR